MVWGVDGDDAGDNAFYRDGPGDGTFNGWVNIPGAELTQVEIGKLGVFGVGPRGEVYYRVGTNGNPQEIGSSWQR